MHYCDHLTHWHLKYRLVVFSCWFIGLKIICLSTINLGFRHNVLLFLCYAYDIVQRPEMCIGTSINFHLKWSSFKILINLFTSTPFLRNGVYVMMLQGILIMLIMPITQFSLIMRFLFLMSIIRACMRPSRNVQYVTRTNGWTKKRYLCIHMHVDNVPSPANSYPNRQRLWPSF